MKDIKDYSVEYYESLANSLHKKSASSSEGGSLGSNHDCDWNTMKSKPFYEETVYGDTLTWDGNTEGKTVLGEVFVKISDETPTLAELINGVVSVGGETVTITEDMIDNSSDNVVNVMGMIYVVSVAGANMYGEVVFPEVGIYTALENGALSLTINGYNGFETKVVKPIDNKYLKPFETVGGDTLTWDGNTDGLECLALAYPSYKISNISPSSEDLANGYTLIISDGATQSTEVPVEEAMDGVYVLGSVSGFYYAMFVVEDISADGMTINKGTYFVKQENSAYLASLTINGYTGFTTTKLKEEYIPVDYIKQLIAEVTGK